MTRRAGWSHPNSKSNTVSGKSSKMRSATYRYSYGRKLKNKLKSIRSNFDLDAFPDVARHASYASRKDFHIYRLYRGWNSEQRLWIGAWKNEKSEIFWKIWFFDLRSLEFHFSKLFHYLFIFLMTRRAGCSHLHSKSNTVSGKSWKMRSATNR